MGTPKPTHGVWSHGPNVTETDHCPDCQRVGPLVTLTQAQYASLRREARQQTLEPERIRKAIEKVRDSDPAEWLNQGDEADAIVAAILDSLSPDSQP